jgi:ABC-2 type transport system permease protein
MTDALHFESVRVRTIRSTYWLAAMGLLLSGLVALAIGLGSRTVALTWQDAAALLTGGSTGLPFTLAGVFAALIGIFATGHEYRHGTIRPTLTAIPRRTPLLAAKVLVVAAVSALIALASIAVCWVVGTVSRGEPVPLDGGNTPQVLAGYVVLVMLYGVLGAALGQLTRAIPGAIVIILVTPLIIEPVVLLLSTIDALDWLRDWLPYMPFRAGQLLVMTDVQVVREDGSALYDPLSRWEGGAVFAGFTAVVLAVAWLLFKRRDA